MNFLKTVLKNNQLKAFLSGIKSGLPIGLGYFAVAFSLGIAARNAGLSAFQGFIASLTTIASAGEYAVFTLIAAEGSYLEVALITLITNARYMLMGCALSQRISPDTSTLHRLLIGGAITDELFGIGVIHPYPLNPIYYYGAIFSSVPLWALGTSLGIIMGNLLPVRIVSALSVALYGMFIAIIIPPTKQNRVILFLVPICFALSLAFSLIPVINKISEGNRIIILTVAISAVAALLFPIKQEEAEA